MTRPLAILDRQHAGKRGRGPDGSRPEDLGAAADVDGDGMVEAWEQEAHLTPVYGHAAQRFLGAQGVPSIMHDPLGSGLRANYSERHEYANSIAADWPGMVGYMAMHLNAGGGRYGLVGYDPRSTGGKALAESIAIALDQRIPFTVLDGVKVVALADRWSRGLPCISGIYPGPNNVCGVLLEPLFIDHEAHQLFINDGGLVEVGHAIGAGFLRWAMMGDHRAS